MHQNISTTVAESAGLTVIPSFVGGRSGSRCFKHFMTYCRSVSPDSLSLRRSLFIPPMSLRYTSPPVTAVSWIPTIPSASTPWTHQVSAGCDVKKLQWLTATLKAKRNTKHAREEMNASLSGVEHQVHHNTEKQQPSPRKARNSRDLRKNRTFEAGPLLPQCRSIRPHKKDRTPARANALAGRRQSYQEIDSHLATRNLSHRGSVDEIVNTSQVHRSHNVEVPQHIQGFHMVMTFHHRDESPPAAARQADVRQGLARRFTRHHMKLSFSCERDHQWDKKSNKNTWAMPDTGANCQVGNSSIERLSSHCQHASVV